MEVIKSVKSECLKRCKELSAPYGFKKAKDVFWRIAGDMFQRFYVDTSNQYIGCRKCRVGFDIFPLCLGIDAQPYIAPFPLSSSYYLKAFKISNNCASLDGWLYTGDLESKQLCCDEVASLLITDLMPFFERTTSSETALAEILKLEKLFNDNRIAGGWHPRREKIGGTPLRYLAIKAGDYDLALDGLDQELKLCVDSYERVKAEHESNYPSSQVRREEVDLLIKHLWSKDYLQIIREGAFQNEQISAAWLFRYEDQAKKVQQLLNHLQAKDTAYFQRLFEENEAASRKSFEEFVNKNKKK